jgi:uncharacterized membrane protein YeiB
MKLKLGPDYLATAIVGSVLLLIFVLTIFVFVQFWYFYIESETTQKKVAEVSASYDDRIKQLTPVTSEGSNPNKDEIVRLTFLKEFKSQQVWERSHERVNRRYFSLTSSAEWFVKLLVLFLAVLNERVSSRNSKENAGLKRGTIVLVVFFAAMSIALPALAHKLGFEARQRLHDFRAQQLGFIITELESGTSDARKAWLRYQELYKESPSSYANRPGF